MISRLRCFSPFSDLDPQTLANLVPFTRMIDVPARRWLLQPGRTLTGHHFLLRGRVRLQKPDTDLAATDSLARFAIFPGHSAIFTLSRSRLLQIESSRLDFLLSPETEKLAETLVETLNEEEETLGHWQERFLHSGLMAPLPHLIWQQVLRKLTPQPVAAGERVIIEGDAENLACCFILAQGSARVHDREGFLRTLEPGDFFGEDALFTRKPRNASVTMHTQGKVMCLPTEDFLEFLTAVSATGGMSAPPPAGSSEGLKCEVVDVDKPGKLRVLLAALNADRRYLITGKHCGLRTLAVFLLRQRGIVAWSSDQQRV